MKQFRRFLWALLLIGMAIAIYSSAVGETAPEKIELGRRGACRRQLGPYRGRHGVLLPHGRGEG